MLLQKLDLVDDHIATTSDVLQNTADKENSSGRVSVDDKEPVVVAFDRGDEDNSGNWPRVSPVQLR